MKRQPLKPSRDSKDMGERGVTAYDVVSRYDDAYFGDLAQRYTGRSRFARRRIANVLALLPELAGRKVLDLGCGMGTFTLESARRGAHAVGIDFMGTAMAAAGRVARTEGVDGAGFVRGDAARLPLKAASFDVVIAADFTEHLDDVTLASV